MKEFFDRTKLWRSRFWPLSCFCCHVDNSSFLTSKPAVVLSAAKDLPWSSCWD